MSGEHPRPAGELLAGYDLPSSQVEQFESYLALLLRWNARMNLTAVRQPDEIVRRHFRECIFAAGLIPPVVHTLLDFGSGAGLPGIPAAICRPEIRVTLAESQGKKASFLREAVRTLGLSAEVWDRRVEEMPAERLFDGVILRAVDRMEEATRLAIRRVPVGGWIGIFATHATEAALGNLAGVRWEEAAAIPETEQGLVKTARRVAE